MCGCHFSHIIHQFERPTTQQAAGDAGEPASSQLVSCQNCHHRVKNEYTWCPYCGAALHDHACRYCQQKVKAADLSCSFCGAPA